MAADVFIHPQAIVEPGATIGVGTRVWAFAHILPGARIGRDCNICDQTFVENDVLIGDRVTIKCGVQIWDGVLLEDDVFVGPNVTFTNDLFPRSKQYPESFSRTVVRQGASLGANSTVLAGTVIGQWAMVGAGAVVTKDVPPHAIVTGNPASIRGYVTDRKESGFEPPRGSSSHREEVTVPGVRLIELPRVTDLRGSLVVAEAGTHLPFLPKRVFAVFQVPNREIRGEHAHRELHQLLVCITGSCSVMVDDGRQRNTFILDSPHHALHVPPMIWASQYHYSPDAVLLVLASDIYNPEDYIRSYDDFLKEKKAIG